MKRIINKKIAAVIVIAVAMLATAIFIGCGSEKAQLSAPTGLRIDDDVLIWNKVDGAVEYVVVIDGDKEYITDETSFDLFTVCASGTHTIAVRAYGELEKVLDSQISRPIRYVLQRESLPLKLKLNADKASYSVYGTSATRGKVALPSKYGGLPITLIPEDAFKNCTAITSIYIPDSVTKIGANAFYGCKSLKRVRLSGNLVTLHAFSNCESLAKIEIPASVREIYGSFYGCEELEVTLRQGNKVYKEDGNCIIKTDDDTLVVGNNNSVIPSYVKSIGMGAFYGRRAFKQAVVLNNVTQVAALAFMESGITSVTIENPETIIGDKAFASCKSLREVILPDEINPDSGSFIRSYYSTAFNDSAMESISIPNGIKAIGKCFSSCKNLKRVYIPASVQRITMSDTSGAFVFCGGIENFEVSAENDAYMSRDGNVLTKDGKTLVLGSVNGIISSGVEAIGDGAFLCRYGTESLVIPVGVTAIGNSAFAGCVNIKEVYIPDSVKSIGKGVFQQCVALGAVTFADTIERISPNDMFYGDLVIDEKTGEFYIMPPTSFFFPNPNTGNSTYVPYVVTSDEPTTYPAGWRLGDTVSPKIFINSSRFDGCAMRSDNGYSYVHTFTYIKRDYIDENRNNAKPQTFCTFKAAVLIVKNLSAAGNEKEDEEVQKLDYIANPRAPTRLGYVFKGWAAEENGEPVYKAYRSESGYLCALSSAERKTLVSGTTLYAVWQKAE